MNKAPVHRPTVAAVITTFKRPDLVVGAVESVLAQDYPVLEILVIDDNVPGSKDQIETQRRVAPLLNADRGRYLSTGGRLGAPQARNLGITETSASLIAFLDDDDRWLPEKISAQVHVLETAGKNCPYAYTALEYRDGSGRTRGYRRRPPGSNALLTHLQKNLAPTSCLLFRRSVIEKIGGFKDVPAGQEFEIQLRMLTLGHPPAFVDRALVLFGVHDKGRITTGREKIEAFRWLLELKRQYYPEFSKPVRRRIEASSLYSLGRHLVVWGELAEGRRHLFASFRLRPIFWRTWAWLLVSLLPLKRRFS